MVVGGNLNAHSAVLQTQKLPLRENIPDVAAAQPHLSLFFSRDMPLPPPAHTVKKKKKKDQKMSGVFRSVYRYTADRHCFVATGDRMFPEM